jgi:branched-chain amino acid transport system substrate-binding protein
VFFPIFMPEGGFVVQQVGSVAGLEDVKLIVSAALLVDNFMELAESEGVYISGPDLRFGSNRNSVTGRTAESLLAEYVESYGEEPSGGYWGHAYDATVMLLRAIERVAVEIDATLYIDRQDLRDEIDRSTFDGIIGPISCDEYGDCGSQRITVLYNTDPRNIEVGKNNVVFDFAP